MRWPATWTVHGRRLHVVPTVLRAGKKIQVVQLVLLDGDVEHVRVSALRLRDEDLSGLDVPASTTEVRPADVLAVTRISLSSSPSPNIVAMPIIHVTCRSRGLASI